MYENLIPLVILFLVIFDPFASFAVFSVATASFSEQEKRRTAALAILVAATISFCVLFVGAELLWIFSTTISNLKIAGGILLIILGIQMSLGLSMANMEAKKDSSGHAIAALIATPLLTGPAAITAIIASSNDYGLFETGIAITVVMTVAAVFLLLSSRISRYLGKTLIQVLSTLMGLITVAWGVKFIRDGLLMSG